ncbi:WXG100 family type VII secretion target [Mycolicibacterium brumae]|uniref:WXG100 family type VII secretion target n=1 Tax=Mycolicibacterium brumae TaxID=85968 RepID=UPI001F42A277|nr:hypothetical protein [Mycolicibacterium brumae]UWW08169.1 hypothetical protein L2Z93_001212 [Mycolicibacterium brumae]
MPAAHITPPSTPAPPVLTAPATPATGEGARLQTLLANAMPSIPAGYIAGVGMPGGADVPMPTGLFTYALIQPGLWPLESESQIDQAAQQLGGIGSRHEDASTTARARTDAVFSGDWVGQAAQSADAHYTGEHSTQIRLAGTYDAAAQGYRRLGPQVRDTKRKMFDANTDAHNEIDQLLKSDNFFSTAQIPPILTKYRGLITSYSGELAQSTTTEISLFTNRFGDVPATPMDSDGDGGLQDDDPTGGDPAVPDPDALGEDLPTGPGLLEPNPTPGGLTDQLAPLLPAPVNRLLEDTPIGKALNQALPQIPQIPQLPGSGAGDPLKLLTGPTNPLTSLFRGTGLPQLPGDAGKLLQPQALNQHFQTLAAFGDPLSRGMTVGTAAVQPLVSGAPPTAPPTPLAAPAPATAPVVSPPTVASAPAPVAAAPATSAGAPMPPMTPYGSVMPPAAGTAPAGAPVPMTPASPVAPAAATAPASVVPAAVRDVSGTRVKRELAVSDLDTARAVVADLAAASSVSYPGLEWAVGVARGPSGVPEFWIVSNEGASYIPAGVYVPRTMPLVRGMDPDFDARWFGWFDPAETVWRSITSRGLTVSAIATTWSTPGERVTENVPALAAGVLGLEGGPPAAEAAQPARNRSHRLETLSDSIWFQLQQAERTEMEEYCRALIERIAFAEPALSSTAQDIARTIAAGRWPTADEWAALQEEYQRAQLMAGAQRPGLLGIEDPEQLVAYQADFMICRRLEALLAWERGDLADLLYAALVGGVDLSNH